MTRCLLTLIAILFATPAAAADEEFTYDPIGKRDPFRGLVDEPPPPTPHSVLSAWGLAELRLVAVADAEGGRYAMVEPPQGPGALLVPGSRLGKEAATVLLISPDRIVVRQERRLADGGLLVQDYELPLESTAIGLPRPAPGP